MQQPQRISLQRQLVKSSIYSSIAAGILAFILLLLVTGYQSMSINDEIMDEITDVLLTTDLTQHHSSQIDGLSDEFEIGYQLGFAEQLLLQSEDFPQIDLSRLQQLHSGYHYLWSQYQLWRIYKHQDEDAQFYALTVQPLTFRFEESLQSIMLYVWILLLLWLLQWGLVHFAIKKQFRHIHLLSSKISSRNAQNLTPIEQYPVQMVELEPIVKQLNQLLGKLQASMLAEQRFTADASHELRSPLSAIQMRLQLLGRKYQQQTDFQYDLQQIQKDVNRSQHILENLLLLARLDPSAADQLPKCHFDLCQLIDEVLKSLQPFMLEKGISYQLAGSSLTLYANQQLMYSCIRNILDNAIRYASINAQIYIHFSDATEMIEIQIENSAEQFNAEILAHLGERFYRALGSKTTGSGLGLSICKKILELHQGSMTFQHSKYGGLKVMLALPK